MRSILTIVIAAMCLVAAGTFAAAEEATYIGAAKCKMCHKVEFASWEGLSHSKAFDRLKPEEQTNAECLSCHATGGTADLPGVQCESCHGPGSGYKSLKVMKDHEASVAAGLIVHVVAPGATDVIFHVRRIPATDDAAAFHVGGLVGGADHIA